MIDKIHKIQRDASYKRLIMSAPVFGLGNIVLSAILLFAELEYYEAEPWAMFPMIMCILLCLFVLYIMPKKRQS